MHWNLFLCAEITLLTLKVWGFHKYGWNDRFENGIKLGGPK